MADGSSTTPTMTVGEVMGALGATPLSVPLSALQVARDVDDPPEPPQVGPPRRGQPNVYVPVQGGVVIATLIPEEGRADTMFMELPA